MDDWFRKTKCDRCGGSVADGFTMSRFNTDAICPKCQQEERQHPDYKLAAEAELAAVKAGDRNFPGIGWPGKNGRVKQ